jgi:hypothetical protein
MLDEPMGGGNEEGSRDGGCPGMWRLVEAVLDRDEGAALTVYVCDLCGETMIVPPGGTHPTTA